MSCCSACYNFRLCRWLLLRQPLPLLRLILGRYRLSLARVLSRHYQLCRSVVKLGRLRKCTVLEAMIK